MCLKHLLYATFNKKLKSLSTENINPCCNGMCLIIFGIEKDLILFSLNPCCNGIYLIMLRMEIIDNSTHCFIKRRDRTEVEVNSKEKDIFESKMNGNEISKEEYDEFR